jgi:hypothetical protein
MLKTEAAESGVAQVRLYASIVGFKESAKAPISGMDHFTPGKCFFLLRHTYCSYSSRLMTMTRVVTGHCGSFGHSKEFVESSSWGSGTASGDALLRADQDMYILVCASMGDSRE